MKKIFILVLLFSQSLFAIPEKNYQENYLRDVFPFMQKWEHRFFTGVDKIQISYYRYANSNAKKILVISPGQSEPAERYGEIVYDLKDDFEIYIIDHRGQGLSGRMTKIKEMSYVEKYDDYVEDLHKLILTEIQPNNSEQPLYLLAHSMGSLIGSLYLEKYPTVFEKAVLSAPLHQLDTEPYARWVARTMVGFLSLVGQKKKYGPGQKVEFDPNKSFATEVNTSSPVRFWMKRFIYKNKPELIIGGVSNQWIKATLRSTKNMKKHGKSIKTPTLVFQAGNDALVKPEGQNIFCTHAADCELIVFPTGKHEILLETDDIRDIAINQIKDFLN